MILNREIGFICGVYYFLLNRYLWWRYLMVMMAVE